MLFHISKGNNLYLIYIHGLYKANCVKMYSTTDIECTRMEFIWQMSVLMWLTHITIAACQYLHLISRELLIRNLHPNITFINRFYWKKLLNYVRKKASMAGAQYLTFSGLLYHRLILKYLSALSAVTMVVIIGIIVEMVWLILEHFDHIAKYSHFNFRTNSNSSIYCPGTWMLSIHPTSFVKLDGSIASQKMLA